MINDCHTLIHADDTIVISTSRASFILKCNHMIDYFHANKLSLNLNKSSCLIIMPKEFDRRVNIRLRKGFLKYKSVQTYLGVIITDGGNSKHAVSKYIEGKRSNVLIKFVNFCNKNFMAPFHVKLHVLDTCVTSALLYACKTWADYGKEVEAVYRRELRTALGIGTSITMKSFILSPIDFHFSSKLKSSNLNFGFT